MVLIIKLQQREKLDNIEVYGDLREALRDFKSRKKDQYIPHVPMLPTWTDRVYRYYEFNINLFHLTCTCPDFQSKREEYGSRDVRRICKHIYYKLTKPNLKDLLDTLTFDMIKNAALFDENEYYKYKIPVNGSSQYFYLGYKAGNEWINVYAQLENGNYFNYAFSLIDRRWSYKRTPQQNEKILYYIDKLFKVEKKIVKNI